MDNSGYFYKRKSFWAVVASVVILLLLAIALNTGVMNTSKYMRVQSEGQLRLINITSSVENNLAQAESMVESYAAQLELLLQENEDISSSTLLSFIGKQNKLLYDKTEGQCFSTYIAYKNKLYIEGFVPDDTFRLTERVWYVGAKKNAGDVFITDPYIDANTGSMCYSVSVRLDDGETIVGMDFYMDEIQRYIEAMNEKIDGVSMIVNEGGMIVGHSNPMYVGQDYEVLISYKGLIDKVFNLYGDYFEYKIADSGRVTVFSDKTSYGWYLIVCLPSEYISAQGGTGSVILNIILIFFSISFLVIFVIMSKRGDEARRDLEKKQSIISELSDELRQPLSTIMHQAQVMSGVGSTADKNMASEINVTAQNLSQKIDSLLTDGGESETENKAKEKELIKEVDDNIHKKYARAIVAILTVAAVVAVGVNTFTQLRYMDEKMTVEEDSYYEQVSQWIVKNTTLTNDLALNLGAQPELYEDYEKAVKYIDDVVGSNSDISVAYIVNPAWEHTVIMNNGWQPTDPSWHVEERDWYVDTVLSPSGFNISTPYRDEQTGMYCVTFSQIVYDPLDNIVGLVGVDFYMDTLIDILGASYSEDGYAFLTDHDFTILNHPNSAYQMTPSSSVSAANTEYREALVSEKLTVLTDYDGQRKVALMKLEPNSGFAVVTIKNFRSIYGLMIITDIMLILVFAISILIVLFITRFMSNIQNQMNYQLKKAADEAMAAGKAKSDFLANMSHEIRTPINAVLGMNEMILRESKDSKVIEYANDIQSAGRTLLSIINDILDFSKIDSGKMQITKVNYDTSSLINDLVNLVSERAKQKNLELKLEIDEALPENLYGDDLRIRQIVTNLLTNAVKYTEKGSVTLAIKRADSTKALVDDEDTDIYISVRDTGQGIKEEDIEKLFQSFTRINEKKNRTIEGTGLGINITSSLLSMMGSKLEVESVFGEGSNFYFVLSQKVVSAKPIGDYRKRFLEAMEETKDEGMQRIAPTAKVLIVDDTPMNLRVEANLLKITKVIVDTAASGKEAIEKIKENQYDVIFIDHMMPEMDGIETLEEAKRLDIIKGVPVIALTANAVAGAKEMYLEHGFDNYLSKPVKGIEIENMVFEYVDESKVELVQKN